MPPSLDGRVLSSESPAECTVALSAWIGMAAMFRDASELAPNTNPPCPSSQATRGAEDADLTSTLNMTGSCPRGSCVGAGLGRATLGWLALGNSGEWEPIPGRWRGGRRWGHAKASGLQSILHCSIKLHLQNTNFKDQIIIRILRQWMQSIKPQGRDPSVLRWGPVHLYWWNTHDTGPDSRNCLVFLCLGNLLRLACVGSIWKSK